MADRKFVKFNERQRKVLHLRMNNPIQYLILRATLLESSLAERDLGGLVNSKMDISQVCPCDKRGEWCVGLC